MWLPLFPLHTVLFPGTELPLRVFEPRYRALVAGLDPAEPTFGVVAISAGTEVGAPAEIHPVGTVARVTRLAQSEDGTYDVVVTGTHRFRVVERLPDDPYPQANVAELTDIIGHDIETALAATGAAFARYAVVLARLGVPIEVPSPGDPVATSFTLSALLQVDVPVMQKLLASETASERLQLAAAIARREATLLATIGPSAGVPIGRPSAN